MSESRTSFEGRLSGEGTVRISKIRELQVGMDIKTKEGRQELIRLLFKFYGELRTKELVDLLEHAGIHHRSRMTISCDLKCLIAKDEIVKVKKGHYRSKHPSLFRPHEIDEIYDYVRTCKYYVQQKSPKHPIGTTLLLSDRLPPKGLHYHFLDLGERVLSRCVQNTLFSSYLRVAGQKHVPIAPCQLKGRVDIPEDYLEQIWLKKAFKGKLLVAFSIDFQELRKWLKTEEGRDWLRRVLLETPNEYQQIASAIVKVLELVYKKGSLDAKKVATELGKLGISDRESNQIITWILPYLESERIEDKVYYRINHRVLNIVHGLLKIEKGQDPARVYSLMQDS